MLAIDANFPHLTVPKLLDGISTMTIAQTSASSVSLRLRLAVALGLAGIGLLSLVGFAQGTNSVVHNAAHDTRHAFTFPCH